VVQALEAVWQSVETERAIVVGTTGPHGVAQRDQQRVARLSQRFGTQALGCVSDAMIRDREALVRHSADLLATLLAIWAETGLDPREVWVELHKREQLGSLLMQLNQAQSQVPRRVLKPWRVDSTKLP
jgi:phosphoribosyl-ATP pyrophosphohydrolase